MLDDLPGGPWLTTVDGFSDDGVVLLAPPRLGGKTVRLPVGRRARISYSLGEVPCEIDAEIVAARPVAPRPRTRAHMVGGPRRMQRRSAVRVPDPPLAQASAAAARRAPSRRPSARSPRTSRAAAPCCAWRRHRRRHRAGHHRGVRRRVGTIALDGRVVRCDRVDAAERPWRVAIAFVDPPMATQDQLVHFLFERQRELRRRESGLD